MEDNWQFYFSYRDGKIASILVNSALAEIAPDTTRPWLLGVRIKMKRPNQNGLSSDAEGATFDRIEPQLSAALKDKFNGIGVGSVRTNGWWELYYYASRADGLATFVVQSLHEFTGYEIMTFSKQDKAWTVYGTNLFPARPKEIHQILNRGVIENLKKLGSDLTRPHRVDHTLLFPTAEKRDEAISLVSKEGFEITDQYESEPSDASRFVLQISRNDSPELSVIQPVVFHLIDLATAIGGEYDGWGAMVIT